jgi:hypothetical protein
VKDINVNILDRVSLLKMRVGLDASSNLHSVTITLIDVLFFQDLGFIVEDLETLVLVGLELVQVEDHVDELLTFNLFLHLIGPTFLCISRMF